MLQTMREPTQAATHRTQLSINFFVASLAKTKISVFSYCGLQNRQNTCCHIVLFIDSFSGCAMFECGSHDFTWVGVSCNTRPWHGATRAFKEDLQLIFLNFLE